MIGRLRLTASSIAGLSLRRRSRFGQTTLTATISTYAIYLFSCKSILQLSVLVQATVIIFHMSAIHHR